MSGTSTRNDWRNPLPGVPDAESPFFDDLFSRKIGNPGWFETARHFRDYGFAVIDFPEADFDQVAEHIKLTMSDHYDWEGWKQHGWATGHGLRVQDAWHFNDAVKKIATNTMILDFLTYLYGRNAVPFQTLNFPVGTQQHYHTDSVHFSSIPERFMCGVWVALEDVDDSNGPLLYYPGSHKLPIYVNEHIGHFAEDPLKTGQASFEPMWRELMRVNGLKPLTFHAKKGQALIWSSNLFHGGERQTDRNRTRWSQVTHYYFEDCVYYTPLQSDPAYGRMLVRDIANISTGKRVDNLYLGRLMPEDFKKRLIHSHSGIDPLPTDFDPNAYLTLNPDVSQANIDPVQHFLNYGHNVSRAYKW